MKRARQGMPPLDDPFFDCPLDDPTGPANVSAIWAQTPIGGPPRYTETSIVEFPTPNCCNVHRTRGNLFPNFRPYLTAMRGNQKVAATLYSEHVALWSDFGERGSNLQFDAGDSEISRPLRRDFQCPS